VLATHLQVDLAVVVLASVFVIGKWFHISDKSRSRRWITASAGASVAYIWLRMLPELSEAQHTFTRITQGARLPMPEFRIYMSGLLGFVVFFGLEQMTWFSHAKPRGRGAEARTDDFVYRVNLAGFLVYGALVSYLMVRDAEYGALSLLLYLIAMGLHFVVVDHSLREQHGDAYDRRGRWLLASVVLLGGFSAKVTVLPEQTVLTLLGLVAGGVISNNTLMELTREKEGSFFHFFVGAMGYALLLALI
jgi:hypothetical protein